MRSSKPIGLIGATWNQQKFSYQGKCLQWINQRYAELDEDQRRPVDAVLAGSGCEGLFSAI
ncbi:hypothetical protein NYF23_06485 [SAR92 clade bacterium H455]|uniref:Uncharacterized protein n=1 Tax=SAR92 clade bacterium H455 TaxID=2974818 RepID=A0ABY5TQZ5_9GAMM|nr:hypothetical protein NYF23_06485 [SAR92 clade bacterium H455]